MSPFQYLTEEWRTEAERRLKAELTPERMNSITSSMSNVYLDCPGGGSKYLLFRFENGALTELGLGTGEPPEAEFHGLYRQHRASTDDRDRYDDNQSPAE